MLGCLTSNYAPGLTWCQINPIDLNFHLQKSLEIFDTNSADKNLVWKEQGVESALPHAN